MKPYALLIFYLIVYNHNKIIYASKASISESVQAQLTNNPPDQQTTFEELIKENNIYHLKKLQQHHIPTYESNYFINTINELQYDTTIKENILLFLGSFFVITEYPFTRFYSTEHELHARVPLNDQESYTFYHEQLTKISNHLTELHTIATTLNMITPCVQQQQILIDLYLNKLSIKQSKNSLKKYLEEAENSTN